MTGRGNAVVDGLDHDDLSDDEYLEMIVGRLSPKEQRVTSVLEDVKNVYVRCGRDAVVDELFSDFLTEILAKRNGKRDEGRMFFVTGESGSGKTSITRRVLAAHSAVAPIDRSFGEITPYISLNLMGPQTLKYLGLNILKAAGYPITRNMEQAEVWDLLPKQLHHRKVLLIHLDEAQHMLKLTETDLERDKVARAFKGVTNHVPWPVSFVMSGMPETIRLSKLDGQIERRGFYMYLPDVSLPEERRLIERIVAQLCQAANLDFQKVIESDLPERMAHAARYQYGRIAQVVLAAIKQASFAEAPALTRDHFAYAYLKHSHARGHDQMNPFLVDDWERLEPGSFLIEAEPR